TGYWLTPAATAGRSGRCQPRPPGTPSPTATAHEPHAPRARRSNLSVSRAGNSSVLRVAGATPGHPVPLGGILESAGELAGRPSALVNRVHGAAWVHDSGRGGRGFKSRHPDHETPGGRPTFRLCAEAYEGLLE